jgi:hypothetical protein
MSTVRVTIHRDATLAAREKFRAFHHSIIAYFDSPILLYRIFDGEELTRIISSKEIIGGTYAIKAERSHGASWGSDPDEVIQWGNRQRGKRLGNDLFLASLNGQGHRFYHLGDKSEIKSLAFDPNGPEYQSAVMDVQACGTGLGCSVGKVALADVELFHVDMEGRVLPITLSEAKEYIKSRPKKDIELRQVSEVYYQGRIFDEDVQVVKSQDRSAYRGTWGVLDRYDNPIILGAKSEKIAINRAAKVLEYGEPYGPMVDLLPKKVREEWRRRQPKIP